MYKSNKNKIKRFLSLNLFIGLLAMTTSSFKSYDDKDRISIMTRPEGFKSHNENRISIITRPDEIDIDTLQTTLCPKALMRREWAAMETTIRIPQRTSQQAAALSPIIPAVKQPAALPPIIISPESEEYIRPERIEYVPLPSYLRTENPTYYPRTEKAMTTSSFKSYPENYVSIETKSKEIEEEKISTFSTTLCPKALMRREWAAMETTIRIPQRTSQQPAALPLIIPAVKQPAALPPIIISPESKEYIRPERMEYVPLPSYLRTENPSHYAGTENKEKSFKDWLLSCLEKLSDYFNRNEDEDKDKNQTASTLTYETESRSSSLSENESDSESMFNCFINYFTSCCSGNEYEDENEDGDED